MCNSAARIVACARGRSAPSFATACQRAIVESFRSVNEMRLIGMDADEVQAVNFASS